MPKLIQDKYEAWKAQCLARFTQLKANEEELNRIFIDIYGLQDELTPEVADRDVTVYRVIDKPDEEQRKMRYVLNKRDVIVSLISYAVGCMFGRYSLDVEGLAFAGGEWDPGKYKAFLPDKDNVLPITDMDYFADDIVSRFSDFVHVAYGPDTLEENLRFVAEALGGKGSNSRDVLQAYFLNDFYKDHLQTYKKRPIYWLFDSGKTNAFKALIYLHRYDRDTLARLRTDYVHEQQERLRTQLAIARDESESRDVKLRAQAAKRLDKLQKQIAELAKYEEILHHMADQHIEMDLDDGVVVNYGKMGDLVAKIG